AARRVMMRQVLEPMTTSVFSMSEEARFVFLAGAIGRGVDYVPSPADSCEGQDGVGLLAAQDNIERGVMLQTVFTRSKAWREELAAKYGEQLNGRLKAAATTLEANGLDPALHMSYARIEP
ncbi:MAG: hypothetical protein K0R83_1455, partial [Caulobacter sp.]|nr:hypothetical protein [Caulobacter sp.]